MSEVLIGVFFLIGLGLCVWIQSKMLTPEEQQDFADAMDQFLYGDL